MCRSVLQSVAVYWVPQVIPERLMTTLQNGAMGVAVCCSVLQCVAVCCSVLQCVAVC